MQNYNAERRLAAANPGGTSPGQSWRQVLPVWATIKLSKLLRQTHDGMRDSVFLGLCASPPKGGFNSITWRGNLSQDETLKEEVDAIQKESAQWLDEVRGVAQAAPTEQKKEGNGEAGGAALSKSSQSIRQEVEDKYASIREDMRTLTREIRSAYVSIAPIPNSAPLVKAFVESSALLKKCKTDDGVHRICYAYAITLSWSQRRPAASETDKRAYRPHVIWKDDW